MEGIGTIRVLEIFELEWDSRISRREIERESNKGFTDHERGKNILKMKFQKVRKHYHFSMIHCSEDIIIYIFLG